MLYKRGFKTPKAMTSHTCIYFGNKIYIFGNKNGSQIKAGLYIFFGNKAGLYIYTTVQQLYMETWIEMYLVYDVWHFV